MNRTAVGLSRPSTSCPFKLLAGDDPVHAWREKLLDAFDRLARKSPGYPV